MRPEWLPKELEINTSSLQEDYRLLHEVFVRDLSDLSSVKIDGKGVFIDRSKDNFYPEYERGFLHFVTRGKKDCRVIDYSRAKKLNWILPVLLHYREPEIKAFWSKGPKDESLYLWLEEFDFLIILKNWKSSKNRETRILVTSYSVDSQYRHVLKKRFQKADKVL